MLAAVRSLLLFVALLLDFTACVVVGVFRPRHPNLVYIFSRPFGWVLPLMGIRSQVRRPPLAELPRHAVYICNHQNTFDLFVCANAVPPRTVTIGKRSLVAIPLFGIMYWLTGNILIDRANRARAADTISDAARQIHDRDMSVWVFPEGTRSRGLTLLPFKLGAFKLAARAGVPIIPVVTGPMADTSLNRWDNGTILIQYLPAITVNEGDDLGQLAREVRDQMQQCYDQLGVEQKQLRGR
ncbi:MAG: 1-acylglycerol-3-phosphate O-acyltransferase [Corallincola sp.]|nr:1-acylglycerol-3-phosphate O-acyltransferase [Corallincola sp.]